MKKDISRILVERIESEHLRPVSRWRFVALRVARWSAALLALALAALALAALASVVADLDWSVYLDRSVGARWWGPFAVFPYVWAAVFAALLASAWWGVRRTEHGYRFSSGRLSAVFLAVMIALGAALFAAHAGRFADQTARDRVPGYAGLVVTKEAQWSRPDAGLLAGTIGSVDGKDFSLEDFGGRTWEVGTDASTVVRPSASVRAGETVKVIGRRAGTDGFSAEEIRPWDGRGSGERRRQSGRHGTENEDRSGR